jgi:hypothetical protein
MPKDDTTLTKIGELLPSTMRRIQKKARATQGPSPIQRRLFDVAALSAQGDYEQSILFQHSVFCQTSLPPRDPGADVRVWERQNGDATLRITAGMVMHPVEKVFVPIGLPFGPKARLVLLTVNQRAILTQSPVLDVDKSLTSFVCNMLKLSNKGENITAVKDQLARLSASTIQLGLARDGHATTINSQIVTAFDLWFPKNDRQRVLWPTAIRLSHEYFQDLLTHAVPLDENHIAALSHNSLALDIYSWLAQRLHRVPTSAPQHISWVALYDQFGQGYDRLRKFREVFRTALKQVLLVYRTARVDDCAPKPARAYVINGRTLYREEPPTGLWLYNSPPPVTKQLALRSS